MDADDSNNARKRKNSIDDSTYEDEVEKRKQKRKEYDNRYREKHPHKSDLAKQANKDYCKRYRDKRRTLNLLSTDQTLVQQSVPPQIAGTSTRDVPYVPRTAIYSSGPFTTDDIHSEIIHNDQITGPPSHSDDNTPIHNVGDIIVPSQPPSQIVNASLPNVQVQTYSAFQRNFSAHRDFQKDFVANEFGFACDVCDRLSLLSNTALPEIKLCSTCNAAIKKQRIPPMSVYNGFKYPPVPASLKDFPLDLVTERLISPRIPFMQIRRLRHVHGQYGIYGQVINVPIEVNTMVNVLPRQVDDDYAITVHIKRKKIHKSSYVYGIVRKRSIKVWLRYLKDTPLYTSYDVALDDRFLNDNNECEVADDIVFDEDGDNDILEQIPIGESLIAQQQTLMWDENMYLSIAPGEGNVPISLLFDEHAEELSFPQIYLGQFRQFRDGVVATAFMMATSELRRSDRRGVTPQHLLYMTMKIMRFRIKQSLSIAFRHVGQGIAITKEQIQSDDYMHDCIETNLAFLRSIPNSAYYWAERKRDLFAMIRQYGKPTVFFTISANEIGWPKLLQLLHNLKNNSEISAEQAAELHYIEKSTLINEDAVTCAIYFNKLVNVIMKILQSKRFSPFKQYRVLHYFKRIEFQHRGSPHAHILAWLDNAPEDALDKDYNKAIDLINFLISVSATEASGNIKLQTHRHSFTCYKGIASRRQQKCRFDAPFLPVKETMILTPMKDTEDCFQHYKVKYNSVRKNFEIYDYDDFASFYSENDIDSDEEYVRIIRAGINRPQVFIKIEPSEKWHNPFNPFIFDVVKANTDFQFITEEYSCAAYVVEYVNKTNRGVSNLQRKIIEVMDEHPEFNIFEITKHLSIHLLNQTEMTSQEAAWYLLREPMSKSSTAIEFIPTIWPIERHRVKKTMKQLSELEDDSIDIWKENWFDKYEKRPDAIQNVSLAQFVSKYYKNNKGENVEREEPKVIRYRNYDMATDYNEYRREMVTLHMPFRHEEAEIIAEMRYIQLYDENEALILERRKEFESNLDIRKTLEICRELCREDINIDGEEINEVVGRIPDENPFAELYDNPNADLNDDLRLALFDKLGAIAKKKKNILPYEEFYELIRKANEEQREILFHTMHHLISKTGDMKDPLLVYLTGPAGSGKTFVIKALMEIYNRFSDTDGIFIAYIACASTGKAATAIGGTTVHNALSITLSSMVSAELLQQIDARLRQITGLLQKDFGGLDVILIGDLRQLPPVKATPIFKQTKNRISAETPWRKFKQFELKKVMRQENRLFSSILTKIGDGTILTEEELNVIESRFVTKEYAQSVCPEGTRLMFTNIAVNEYNNTILNSYQNKIISLASDVFVGCHNADQEAYVRQKLHKMKPDETGSLPYELILVPNRPYMITTNIDVADGLSNGTVGTLIHIELNENDEITRIWLKFPKSAGQKRKIKARNDTERLGIDRDAVPISAQTSSIPLNNNKTIVAKRKHFPLVSALAMTIHKSQGGTFDAIVYEYSRSHSRELVYVALSRVTNIEGLFLLTKEDTGASWKFHHGRVGNAPTDDSNTSKNQKRSTTHRDDLSIELKRLHDNNLQTVTKTFIDFISTKKRLSIFSFNCQSLRRHVHDLSVDALVEKMSVLILSETHVSNEETIDIPNLNFIASFKRDNRPAGGVAIYHRSNDTMATFSTDHMEVHARYTSMFSTNVSNIGDICISQCHSNGQTIIMAAVYISPKQSLQAIREFLYSNLFIYSKAASAIFMMKINRRFDHYTMILSGDFNINFADVKNQSLIEFLYQEFDLTMSNDRNLSTTKYKTTIDAVFTRYINRFKSKLFISYFSYHRPIVSVLEFDENPDNNDENADNDDVRVVEIMDEN
ncbi:uncharacterized protein LOC119688206 [Teleopsis dalmanni]|uniref:uncharacterized protein LOC119688206 n=1 Tax=Teleopsis dalmanni TaxID=139649 RepID=UPI0018CF9A05|nr:uncharacterized protein LOC119688206 [Teleopsis dalmanni]